MRERLIGWFILQPIGGLDFTGVDEPPKPIDELGFFGESSQNPFAIEPRAKASECHSYSAVGATDVFETSHRYSVHIGMK